MWAALVAFPFWATLLGAEALGLLLGWACIRLGVEGDAYAVTFAVIAALLASIQLLGKLQVAYALSAWKLGLILPVSWVALAYVFFVSLILVFMLTGLYSR